MQKAAACLRQLFVMIQCRKTSLQEHLAGVIFRFAALRQHLVGLLLLGEINLAQWLLDSSARELNLLAQANVL